MVIEFMVRKDTEIFLKNHFCCLRSSYTAKRDLLTMKSCFMLCASTQQQITNMNYATAKITGFVESTNTADHTLAVARIQILIPGGLQEVAPGDLVEVDAKMSAHGHWTGQITLHLRHPAMDVRTAPPAVRSDPASPPAASTPIVPHSSPATAPAPTPVPAPVSSGSSRAQRFATISRAAGAPPPAPARVTSPPPAASARPVFSGEFEDDDIPF